MTTLGRCFCGAEGREAHHTTATRPGRRFLDPLFTFPTCLPCHKLIHDDYLYYGIVLPFTGTSFRDVQAHKLRCMGLTMLRIAERHPDQPWVQAFAEQLLRMTDETMAEAERARQCHSEGNGEPD